MTNKIISEWAECKKRKKNLGHADIYIHLVCIDLCNASEF